MFKKALFLSLIIFLFTSCDLKETNKIKISTTTWVGYSPLFYAKEKGWLEPLNIKLLNVVSLSENMYLYKAGNSDAYVGTQYEYNILHKKIDSLIPIVLFDRSNGGDVIMSNYSLEKLEAYENEIDVYLEMDSINSILFEDFIKKHKFHNKNFNYINKDQAYISRLKNEPKPTIIVTYTPYNIHLSKNDYKELASTKDNFELLVIDALFTKKEFFQEHKNEFLQLKKLIDISIENLKKDPKEYYEKVKPYLLDTTYEDFLASINDINWINKDIPKEINEKLNNDNFPIRDLIK